MTEIRIMFSRYSAFYSPLIATRAAGFLADEGLDATFTIASPTEVPRARLGDGSVHLIQSAPGASFAPLERGETSEIVHFAQINQRDGFLIAARAPDPTFRWDKLAGARVLVDHGAQPLAMFKFALHRQGVDYGRLIALDAGTSAQMIEAFRAGEADYVHLQGPAPQRLAEDGVARVAASVGEAIPAVAFSSLCAMESFLETERARAFTRAFRRSRTWAQEAPPAEIAAKDQSFFPDVSPSALASAIGRYQTLGCWQGDVEIPADLYQQAVEVFLAGGAIERAPSYREVVRSPPG